MERQTTFASFADFTTQTALQLLTVLILWLKSNSGINLIIKLLPPLELVEEHLACSVQG